MYQDRQEEQDRRRDEAVQARGTKKNVSGENFNILTREYFTEADRQREAENQRYLLEQQAARKQNLIQKGGLGTNLLTGEKYAWGKWEILGITILKIILV